MCPCPGQFGLLGLLSVLRIRRFEISFDHFFNATVDPAKSKPCFLHFSRILAQSLWMMWTLIATLSCASLALAGPGFTGQKVVDGYFTSYNMAPAAVPYSKYTHLNYFVFTTTPSPSTLSLAGIDPSVPMEFVKRAKTARVKTSYTVGGWTGSQYFSQHLASSENRTIFANTLIATMNQYGFDGIDIDWEYPGEQGIGNNIVNRRDSDSFLAFLRTLRRAAPSARISLALSIAGIQGPNGRVTDMTAWLPYIDYITIMTYDVFGTWNAVTGPNSPLYSNCSPASNTYSIDSAMQFYVNAGIPASHLLIGFPAYAYAYTVTNPLLSTRCPDRRTSSLAYQAKSTTTTCGNWIGQPTPNQYLYKELVSMDALNTTSSAGFNVSTIDRWAATRIIYNPSQQIMILTEDTTTARTKGTYILTKGLAGVIMFDLNGDDSSSSLISAMRRGMGLR